MRIAGLGFRTGAPEAALAAALTAAGGAKGLDALATVDEKVQYIAAFAAALGLPVHGVPATALRGIATPTRSARVMARFGTGSLAEAAALAAAGRGARLVSARAVSPDAMATAAIAEGDGP